VNLGGLCDQERCAQIGCEIASSVSALRDLGVYLDSELSMRQDVSSIAATCSFHLRRLRQIRRRIGHDLINSTTDSGVRNRKTGLLQFHPLQPVTEHPGAIAGGPKRCSSAVVWSPQQHPVSSCDTGCWYVGTFVSGCAFSCTRCTMAGVQ
jgi:hypothetical protein